MKPQSEPKTSKDGVVLKRIGVSFGATINLGDYESSRVDCWEDDVVVVQITEGKHPRANITGTMSSYVDPSEVESKYEELWDSVTTQVQRMVDKLTGVEEPDPPKKSKNRRKAR